MVTQRCCLICAVFLDCWNCLILTCSGRAFVRSCCVACWEGCRWEGLQEVKEGIGGEGEGGDGRGGRGGSDK